MAVALENRVFGPDRSRQVSIRPDGSRQVQFWRRQPGSYRELSGPRRWEQKELSGPVGVAFPGQGPSEKIAQFYSVLLSFGLVRTAEWIERRIEQKTAVKKIMVRLGAVESLWVPLGAERFGSSLRISELLSQ